MFREGYASKILADVYAIIKKDRLEAEQKGLRVEDKEDINNNQDKGDCEDCVNEETDM